MSKPTWKRSLADYLQACGGLAEGSGWAEVLNYRRRAWDAANIRERNLPANASQEDIERWDEEHELSEAAILRIHEASVGLPVGTPEEDLIESNRHLSFVDAALKRNLDPDSATMEEVYPPVLVGVMVLAPSRSLGHTVGEITDHLLKCPDCLSDLLGEMFGLDSKSEPEPEHTN